MSIFTRTNDARKIGGRLVEGTVIAFSDDIRAGVIRAADGRNFYFPRSQWQSDTAPSAGQAVSFEAAQGFAKAIYPASVRGETPARPRKLFK
jgi:hypothetical protein